MATVPSRLSYPWIHCGCYPIKERKFSLAKAPGLPKCLVSVNLLYLQVSHPYWDFWGKPNKVKGHSFTKLLPWYLTIMKCEVYIFFERVCCSKLKSELAQWSFWTSLSFSRGNQKAGQESRKLSCWVKSTFACEVNFPGLLMWLKTGVEDFNIVFSWRKFKYVTWNSFWPSFKVKVSDFTRYAESLHYSEQIHLLAEPVPWIT